MSMTFIGSSEPARSARAVKTVFFQETSLSGPIAPTGLKFTSLAIEPFAEDLGVQMVEAPSELYPSAATKGKTANSATGAGVPNPNELAYLLSMYCGAESVTTPTHTGVFLLDVSALVAPFTLSWNGSATANIAVPATPDSIQDAMIAAFGRGCGAVEAQMTGVFIVKLWGEYAITSTLTSSAGICQPFVNMAGTTVRRHKFNLGNINVGNIRSFRAYQGELDAPLAGKRYNGIRANSISMNITTAEANMSVGFFGQTAETGQTILSSLIADITQVNANVTGPGEDEEWNFYYGSNRSGAFGPVRLCDAFSGGFTNESLLSPYDTIGCGSKSYRNATPNAPNTSVEVSFAQNTEGDVLLEGVRNGENKIAVFEWKGGEVTTNVPYRIVVVMPHIVTGYQQGTAGQDNNVATYDITGGVTSKASAQPIIYIDCIVPAV